jgi:hypothetical protein
MSQTSRHLPNPKSIPACRAEAQSEGWCVFMKPLEPFIKDKARCESAFTLSLHLSPRRGHGTPGRPNLALKE